MDKKDLAIIGAGIGGIACAVYAHRAGLTLELFERRALGGQLEFVGELDNYIGIPPGSSGAQLAMNLDETIKKLNISPKMEEVKEVLRDADEIRIHTEGGQYAFGTLIIATGAQWSKLGIPGESEFLGKGVSYCAVCDGFFFKNKDVCVIGGGNTAVEEALYLASLCNKVYLIHRRDKLRALDYLQKELFDAKNIEVLFESQLKEIQGESVVKEVLVESKDRPARPVPVNGVFIAIGMKPATETFRGFVECDEKGFIITDSEMRTSKEGVFSCGDCRKRPLRQLVTAAGEGAVAAMSAYRYLKGNYISS